MNNKGFSLIELMTTFMLVSVILFMLVELLLSLKQIYNEGDLKTTLLINQANIERRINDDVFNSNIFSLSSCGTNCLSITTDIGIKELKVEDNKIVYDGYSMKIAKGSTIGNLTFNEITSAINGQNASIYKIDIPLTNRLVEGDYGIHIVKQLKYIYN